METENWSRMVNLTSVRRVKIIIFAFLMVAISTKINAKPVCPWPIRGGKLFRMVVTTSNPLAYGRPFYFKTERSFDGGGSFIGDALGQLVPLGGQYGVIDGVFDATKLDRWEAYMSYQYKEPYEKDDYIKICVFCPCPGNIIDSSSTETVIKNSNAGIEISHNPISSKDFATGNGGNGVKITVFPIPKGGEVPIVKIFDSFGYLVKDLSDAIRPIYQNPDSTYGVVYWNGRNQKGNKVASGAYIVCAQMTKGKEAEIWRRKFAVSR
jgi:hypothetical protein